MGTDSGVASNPGRWQGYFEQVEMEMMNKAGMSPMKVIVASTGDAAKIMGLKQVGTLQPGNWADLVVLRANPLDNIRNTRTIDSVWIAGGKLADVAAGDGKHEIDFGWSLVVGGSRSRVSNHQPPTTNQLSAASAPGTLRITAAARDRADRDDDVLLAVDAVGHRRPALRRGHQDCSNFLPRLLVVGAQHRSARVLGRRRHLHVAADDERLGDEQPDVAALPRLRDVQSL